MSKILKKVKEQAMQKSGVRDLHVESDQSWQSGNEVRERMGSGSIGADRVELGKP